MESLTEKTFKKMDCALLIKYFLGAFRHQENNSLKIVIDCIKLEIGRFFLVFLTKCQDYNIGNLFCNVTTNDSF